MEGFDALRTEVDHIHHVAHFRKAGPQSIPNGADGHFASRAPQ